MGLLVLSGAPFPRLIYAVSCFFLYDMLIAHYFSRAFDPLTAVLNI